MRTAGRAEEHSVRYWRGAVVFLLLAYFLAMSWERSGFRFAADDMMNMAGYFRLGPARALATQFLVWQGFYRPLGAAFYLPLRHWFGLNPAPFQIAILFVLAVNIFLAFRVALALGCSELTAGLATLAVAYHAGLANLQYNVDMVYDVLCFAFYLGALWYYIATQSRQRAWRWREIGTFLLLYLCALNAKEMALTLPLVLLAYEWFYRGHSVVTAPSGRGSETGRGWIRGTGRVSLLAGALALLSHYGKKFGAAPLLDQPGYQPAFTLHRFMEFEKGSLDQLSGNLGRPSWRGVAALWAVVTFLAWRRNRPALRFAWAYMLLTPLPVMFLADRLQGCLYIPLFGWAIFGAWIFVEVAHAAAGWLAGEPGFQRLGRGGVFALLLAAGVLVWVNRMRYLKATVVEPAATVQGVETAEVIGQLRALGARVRPQSQVVFLNDPFKDWDMAFIGALWFGDRSVRVYNQRTEQLSPAELARMDYVFAFQDGKLVQVR